jgi:diguanylate cyclase (GGDEF)-like protein
MILATFDDSSAILLTIVFVIITLALCGLIFLSIQRNIAREKEEKNIIVENAISKRALVDSVNSYIKRIDRFGVFTLMSIDIDGFGDLNEIFGEKTCDEILRELAARVLRVLPYKASLCRYDGDEFLVFIKDEDSKQRNEALAKKILEAIAHQYQIIIGEAISMTASIGIVTYPTAGDNFNDLYKHLELTKYVSKRDGGNKFTNFYASIAEEETENREYYLELKKAITNKEFVLYYQPIVNLKEHTLIGAECLMRWNHPTKGVQAPQTFLKVMENSGDIKWVGEWGVETMVRFRKAMQEKHPEVPLTLTLNLSTKQLLDSKLAANFISILQKNNEKPEHFVLEISDFMMVEKINIIKTNIHRLRDFGFKVAVDGFEMNGQTVQTIQRAPVDVIKLGRSFLNEIESNFMKEKLLEILVQYATDNNRKIISEGIENAKVVKYVKEQNVNYGQGFYFAKPMSDEDFANYIENKSYLQMFDEVSALEFEAEQKK